MAANHRRTLQLAGAVLALSLGLAGCSSAPEPVVPTLPEGHAPIATGSAAPSAAATPEAENTDVVSISRIAVASGIARAYAMGFDKAREITGAEMESLRQPPADTLKNVIVDPAKCAPVLEGLNWSPAQQGGEAARSDFINEKIKVTGSVEVAKIQDQAQLDAHIATVKKLLGECNTLTMNDGSGAIGFTAVAPKVKVGTTDSALQWTRGQVGHPMRQQSLVLIKTRGQHVAMASFIAADNLQKPDFTKIAAQVLDAALEQL